MARLESILFTPFRSENIESRIVWRHVNHGSAIDGLPQIFWSNGMPWREANLWLMGQACSKDVNLRTVQTKATSLHAYAKWLEVTDTKWWDFPARKENRCLVKYRGYLTNPDEGAELASSTTSQRMRVVISFYRWLKASRLISPDWPMWRERTVGIRLKDNFGFERTLGVNTTDLAILNRPAPGDKLEDGLLPVSAADRNRILDYVREHASEELFLLLSCGFFTGMRIQTLTDLKVSTLTNAVPDPASPGLYRLAVGPGASPQVATKFGVTGQIWIPKRLLDELIRYAHSERRLKREIMATKHNKDILFLTRFGNPYAQRGSDKSPAVNVEMHKIRKQALAKGILAMRKFRFHQTRCTFATELARISIKAGGAIHAVAIVKDALLHKHESTSLEYIKFIEKSPIKEKAANTFTQEFLGLVAPRNDSTNE